MRMLMIRPTACSVNFFRQESAMINENLRTVVLKVSLLATHVKLLLTQAKADGTQKLNEKWKKR